MPANSWLIFRNTRPLVLFFSTLTFVASFAQTQKPIFPTPAISSSTVAPGSVIGDFNGDGLPDTASLSAPTITVQLNQGPNNAPTPVITNGLTCTPQAPLVAADINKDSKLDLAFTCQEGYVVVLLGNGDGTFLTPSYYAVPNANNIATPVDLNGDGYPDIVATSKSPQANGTPSVVVLLNQGTTKPGSLSPPKSYPPFSGSAGPSFSAIGTGDFNGDGKQDVFVGSSTMEVFFGNGDGTLQAPQLVSTTTGATGVFAFGDFNQDGITDIAYIGTAPSSSNPQSLNVTLGSSTGQFGLGSIYPLFNSQTYQAITPFKSTSTSKIIDLAVTSDSATIVALGDGNGNYTLGQSYSLTGNPILTQVAANKDTNLLFGQGNQTVIATGNGDGTFQVPPATSLNGTPFSTFTTADINGDGLTDILSSSASGYLVAALGRGNGTFYVTSQTLGAAAAVVIAGDFNSDGKIDAVAISPGQGLSINGTGVLQDAELFLSKGNGDGTFLATGAGIDLHVIGATSAVIGDFNGDGNMDVVISYSNVTGLAPTGIGLVFLPGKGDGTFGTPIPFSQSSSVAPFGTGKLLVADLNKDGHLDLIWNNAAYLGNGDGTFVQAPTGISSLIVAVGDLNGDGIPDVVTGPTSDQIPNQANVYAGNSDGSFQSTPIFTFMLPAASTFQSAVLGDVNADGHPDLLVQYATTDTQLEKVAVALGDGKGGFVSDSNPYYTGPTEIHVQVVGAVARLNNQAPALPGDNTLDYLAFNNFTGNATSLLNQLNPTPGPPTLIASATRLVVSPSNVAPARSVTLAVGITGLNPTGSISFTANGAALGTAPVIKGDAVLVVSFPAAGTYSVTATYSGDNNNQPSSTTVSIPVAQVAPSVGFGASTLTPGANQPLTLSVSMGGYVPTGTITFSFTGGATIGTATLVQSNTTFTYAFPAAGKYSVTASYSGDAANLPATSDAIAFTVLVPDFLFSSPGAIATITAGQSATTTLNIISEYGYHGTINFSCSGLTTGENCTFTPASLTAPADGQLISSTIVTSTTTSAYLNGLAEPLRGIAWASLLCLALSPRRIRQLNLRLIRASVFTLLLLIGFIHLTGCSSGSSSPSGSQNSGTPKGTQTITVTAADSAGGPSHSLTLQLTVQ